MVRQNFLAISAFFVLLYNSFFILEVLCSAESSSMATPIAFPKKHRGCRQKSWYDIWHEKRIECYKSDYTCDDFYNNRDWYSVVYDDENRYAHPEKCKERCVCKNGYVRINGFCFRDYSTCPLVRTCESYPNQVFKPCITTSCPMTSCSALLRDSNSCNDEFEGCQALCVCKQGWTKNKYGRCVKFRRCKNEVCQKHERLIRCVDRKVYLANNNRSEQVLSENQNNNVLMITKLQHEQQFTPKTYEHFCTIGPQQTKESCTNKKFECVCKKGKLRYLGYEFPKNTGRCITKSLCQRLKNKFQARQLLEQANNNNNGKNKSSILTRYNSKCHRRKENPIYCRELALQRRNIFEEKQCFTGETYTSSVVCNERKKIGCACKQEYRRYMGDFFLRYKGMCISERTCDKLRVRYQDSWRK